MQTFAPRFRPLTGYVAGPSGTNPGSWSDASVDALLALRNDPAARWWLDPDNASTNSVLQGAMRQIQGARSGARWSGATGQSPMARLRALDPSINASRIQQIIRQRASLQSGRSSLWLDDGGKPLLGGDGWQPPSTYQRAAGAGDFDPFSALQNNPTAPPPSPPMYSRPGDDIRALRKRAQSMAAYSGGLA